MADDLNTASGETKPLVVSPTGSLSGPTSAGDERTPTGSVPVITVPPVAAGRRRGIQVVGQGLRGTGRWSLMALVVAALVSFFAVSQLRGPDKFRQQLGTESEGDLARILASLSSESTALQEELGALKVDLANLQNSSAAEGTAEGEATAQLNSLRILAGTVAANGPGLEMVIEDPEKQVTYDALVDAVQELRDAGAEALAVNGHRIGVASSFGDAGGITLDGSVLDAPYRLAAIGPASTMEGGLQIPGGALDSLRALRGVQVDVNRSDSLNLSALDRPPVFRAARPIGSGS